MATSNPAKPADPARFRAFRSEDRRRQREIYGIDQAAVVASDAGDLPPVETPTRSAATGGASAAWNSRFPTGLFGD